MTRSGRWSLGKAFGIVGGVVSAFWLLQRPVRLLESQVASYLADRLGRGAVFNIDTTILILPSQTQVIATELLPSCSSLASVLAAMTLFAVGRGRPLRRRLGAVVAGAALVIVGNMIRLVGSLVVGSYGGRFALVAFHDLAGGTFTFIYVLGGFATGLYMLLPKSDNVEVAHVR